MSKIKETGSKSRQARWMQKLRSQGLERCEVMVPREFKPVIHRVADALRNGGTVLIGPSKDWREVMSEVDVPWTTKTLYDAIVGMNVITPAEATVEVVSGADPVVRFVMHEVGDLVVYVSVSGEQIVTSTLLWPRSQQENPVEFEGMMLRNHKKYLPLASLGIVSLANEEWYELFGSMSARSSLAGIATEIRTIADNAVELSAELGPHAKAA